MRQLTCHNRQKEQTFTETNDDQKSTYILYECIPLHNWAHTCAHTQEKYIQHTYIVKYTYRRQNKHTRIETNNDQKSAYI